MATKPKGKPADDACQAKTGTDEQQNPAGKDKGNVEGNVEERDAEREGKDE